MRGQRTQPVLLWPVEIEPGGHDKHDALPVVAEKRPGPQPLQLARELAKETADENPAGPSWQPMMVLPAT